MPVTSNEKLNFNVRLLLLMLLLELFFVSFAVIVALTFHPRVLANSSLGTPRNVILQMKAKISRPQMS